MEPKNDAPAPVPGTEPDVTPATLPLRWVKVTHHTPDHIASRYPYAGYGSNLSLEQMSRRCHTAVEMGTGVLRNAKLIFAYYLGVLETEGSTTPVAVFKMTAADVAALDRCEGLGRSYHRYLVTIEMNGEAVRCFTYVKVDNRLEEPSESYYQRCLKGYADFGFDARRLRHAREDARKNGIKRTYSPAYGWYDGANTEVDWNRYRGGRRPLQTPTVPTVADYDREEPLGDEARAKPEPRVSLVTGRNLDAPRNRAERRQQEQSALASWRAKHGSARPYDAATPDDPARVSTLNAKGQQEFTNPRNGEQWRKGSNGVWFRTDG